MEPSEDVLQLALAAHHFGVLAVQVRVALLHGEQHLVQLLIQFGLLAVLAVQGGVAVLNAQQHLLKPVVPLVHSVHLAEHRCQVRGLHGDAVDCAQQRFVAAPLVHELRHHVELLHHLQVALALQDLLLHRAQALGDELRARQHALGRFDICLLPLAVKLDDLLADLPKHLTRGLHNRLAQRLVVLDVRIEVNLHCVVCRGRKSGVLQSPPARHCVAPHG
mmetsp:Transcript_80861/g.187741  ORF Transcript_80861/g.187741 Transcript_80861/m.187741 type:complete len:220 (+) Transcript_80861:1765-2424(+)